MGEAAAGAIATGRPKTVGAPPLCKKADFTGLTAPGARGARGNEIAAVVLTGEGLGRADPIRISSALEILLSC